MALGSGPGASGHVRGRRRAKKRPLSEINVTPLVDVMLVLLIIFMISAPLLTVGVPLELPRTDATSISTDNEPISVSVERSGVIYVDQDPATLDQLGPRVAAIAGAGVTDRPIFVRADGAASYEAVARVMARLSASGFSKINLVTDTVPTGAISTPVESEG
ncbi:MAG: ExbD/TolR family protein [Brevundimonas sp.]